MATDFVIPTEPIPLTQCEFANKGTTDVSKGWGSEFWIANSEKYCGKLLRINKGCRCSWHFHRKKDETFYCLSGSFEVVYGESDDIFAAKKIILNAHDTFHVPVGLRHSMFALDDNSVLLEISTEHKDTDSIRILKGD